MCKICFAKPLFQAPRGGRAAGAKGKFWTPGQDLTIEYIGGSLKQRLFFEEYAQIAFDGLNLNPIFGAKKGTIRVSWDKRLGSWSYIGTDAKYINPAKPTMNIGWDDDGAMVLHEVGHAKGRTHEHKHPEAKIDWNKEYNYELYAKQGWSKREVDWNIHLADKEEETVFTAYNRYSIMHYAIEPEMTLNGYSVGWNQVITKDDFDFERSIYAFADDVQPTVEETNLELSQKRRIILDIFSNDTETDLNKILKRINRNYSKPVRNIAELLEAGKMRTKGQALNWLKNNLIVS